MTSSGRLLRRSILAAALLTPALRRGARAQEADAPAVQARPDGAGPFPVVIVAADAAGPPEWIAETCRRLARAGYLAIAPDLWTGPDPADADIIRRLDAAIDWARQHDGDPARIALAGFGRGGRIAWLYAAQTPTLKAAVAWGGPVGGPTSPAHPKNPIDVAADLKAPLLALIGKNDPANPRALLLRAEAAGHNAEIVVYTGAGAAFAEPGRPTHDPAAAMDGWDRMLAWFKRHGL